VITTSDKARRLAANLVTDINLYGAEDTLKDRAERLQDARAVYEQHVAKDVADRAVILDAALGALALPGGAS
jgi:hypothetical protein